MFTYFLLIILGSQSLPECTGTIKFAHSVAKMWQHPTRQVVRDAVDLEILRAHDMRQEIAHSNALAFLCDS